MNTGFEGLDDALNTDYSVDTDLNQLSEKSEQFEKNKKAIVSKPDATIDDKEYLELELKTLIQDTRRVMEILENDIKIGCKPRYHEVYATLGKSALDGIKELRGLHIGIANLKLQKEKIEYKRNRSDTINNTQVNFNLSGNDLFDMITHAKETSQLKDVTAEFHLTDGGKPK